ncbi:Zn-dependent hydrolase of the beta-lactamase fold protein [Ruminiclostridium papyrosolvens DSM 2782]|uniref:Zn-dependent hydrolase of the beta-lactamase fold protein n=1 Tax=Ruminiclostridium papyrosolvens DSM 2782 TaxID=588581 RepID=F1T7E3_9FIRM|nr:MBL fold metallo-hydrolase [Ruminiclostridium papyrosolvens]EGD49391.1 Zn-dependent hydrolase of the beta-lactamase fold protein [Ruminiclostridium papyrosolvens DSM 2782]WES33482.1 MBL fold metallo-hydrolase [Ruminiclostridium papyrosolvens DSM 2782]
MKIKWFGHSCFLITSENGTRILTDPFDEQVGYPLPHTEAEIVTVSHNHSDHDNVGVVKGAFKHIKDAGAFSYRDIGIKGISTFHDELGGAKRGKNIVFIYSIDGMTICHLGDLGHVLSQEQIREMGKIDVLLLPIGGVYTIDSDTAITVAKSINPRITIPMHYKTEHLSFELAKPQSFMEKLEGKRYSSNELTINKDNLSEYPEVVAIDYL